MTPTEDAEIKAAPMTTMRRGRLDGILQLGLVFGVLAAGLITNRVLSNQSIAPQIRAAGRQIVSVFTVIPDVRDIQIRLRETGTVQVRNAIDLSPQVGGRVVSVNPALASGGAFNAGEVLFRLDDSDYRAAIERANVDLSARQADLQTEQAEAAIARREWELVRPGEPIPSNVAREPQLNRAQSAVRSAEAALADARLDLSRVSFSLPFDGRILTTTIEVGQNLMAGQSYGRAYDPEGIEVSVPVNAAVLQGLSPVAEREATVRPRQFPGALGETTYRAKVTRADAELDAQTRLARLTLATAVGLLLLRVSVATVVQILPGEFVDVEIEGPTVPDAHLFPESAVQENRNVWVVEDGRLALRRPQLMSLEDERLVARPFDSASGIVVSPLNNPREGDKVAQAGGISSGGGAE